MSDRYAELAKAAKQLVSAGSARADEQSARAVVAIHEFLNAIAEGQLVVSAPAGADTKPKPKPTPTP